MASSFARNEYTRTGDSFYSPRFWLPLSLIMFFIFLIWWWSDEQSILVTSIEDENDILLVLQTRSNAESSREKQLKTHTEDYPEDIDSVAELTQLYIERSRKESDPRYLGYAQHLLNPWWSNQKPPLVIQRLRAILLQSQHQFAPALADLNALLQSYPGDAQSLLTRATVHQVLGNYTSALKDCTNLLRYAPLPAIACVASIQSLTGQTTDARNLLAGIEPQLASQPVSTRQWIRTLQGEIAVRKNQPDQAEKYYQLALTEPLRSAYLLREYSQFLLDNNSNEKVLSLLEDETHDDSLLLHAAIAADKTQNKDKLRQYSDLIETRLRNAKLRGENNHYYLEARYALDLEKKSGKALLLAKSNWQKSKEPRDTELFVAAAVANDDQSSLHKISDWMLSQKAVLPSVMALLNTNGSGSQ